MNVVPGLTLPAAPSTPAKPENPAARRAAEDFESVFINQLLEGMSEGLKSEEPFSGGDAEKTYRSILNDSIAKEIARHGGVGIADQVYREILKMQEGAAPQAASQMALGGRVP